MHLFQKPLPKDRRDEELLEEIKRVKRQMENANYNFQNAMDPDLIDSYIYEINSLQMRYKHLTDLAALEKASETKELNVHSPIRALVSHVFG